MSKRARVMAALRGEPVDRVPLAFWLHNFATENTAAGLAAETARLARTFDWDYLKPQSRAQCFAQMWGLTYEPSRERAVPYTITHAPIADADDLRQLDPADPQTGALGEQIQALRMSRAQIGADTPIIWTIFAPAMVLPYLVRGGRERALELARSDGAATARALDAIALTLTAYARLCLEAGADGLFYATNVATRELVTTEECRRLHRAYDLRILAAVESAPSTCCTSAAAMSTSTSSWTTRSPPSAGRAWPAIPPSRRGIGAPAAPPSAACPPSPRSRR
jgi:uroporphyrinogen decarboxylase